MKYTVDFETITNPEDCRVWAFGIATIEDSPKFIYGNNINNFMETLKNYYNSIFYFHNLKFDISFILYWLFENNFKYKESDKLIKNTFNTLISSSGLFYSLKICFNENKFITFYDSLKILPFSVSQIAKSFNLEEKKGTIDYDAYRSENHILTDDEKEYLKNDVFIVAKALNTLFKQNLTKMTQGSNALADFKNNISKDKFLKYFPPPYYDNEIRESYKGGFTYVNPKYKNKDIKNGIVLDVNSLYSYVMYNKDLPYGEGKFFKEKYQNDKLYPLYIQMFKCQFDIKVNKIPTIQLKNNFRFLQNEYLESSNDEEVTLCLTSVDLDLFLKHYDVYNIEWISGWKFKSSNKLFKKYIDKWIEVKIKSELEKNYGMRTLAKLMLNALYGKFALNPKVQSKIPVYIDNEVKFINGKEETREPIYLPVGTFVTAYARNITITSAQKNYKRFIYADTDSLHLVGSDIPDNLEIHPTKLGAWKHESTFIRAKFLRQKCYIEEEITDKSFYLPDKKLYSTKLKITCSGMPSTCYKNVTWENFKLGTGYNGKLTFKRVKGGAILIKSSFTLKS